MASSAAPFLCQMLLYAYRTQTSVLEGLVATMAAGIFHALLAGPPGGPSTSVRSMPGGPRHLRTREEPWGRTGVRLLKGEHTERKVNDALPRATWALAKGRPSARPLLRLCRLAAAVVLTSGMNPLYRYIASEVNPADGPSRGLGVGAAPETKEAHKHRVVKAVAPSVMEPLTMLGQACGRYAGSRPTTTKPPEVATPRRRLVVSHKTTRATQSRTTTIYDTMREARSTTL